MDVPPQKSLFSLRAARSELAAILNAKLPVTWFHRSKNRYKCTNSNDRFLRSENSGVQRIHAADFVYAKIRVRPWFTPDGEMV